MRVTDDELHSAQAALDQGAQEAAPEDLSLRLADVESAAVAGLLYGSLRRPVTPPGT